MINPLRFALSIARMQENQRKSREEIHEIQETKLLELLYHARENIPHYRSLPRITDLEGLQELPILEKNEVRRDPGPLINRKADRSSLIASSTSGSSGKPVVFYSGEREEMKHRLDLHRFRLVESGFGPLDHMAFVTSSLENNPFFGFGPFYRTTFLPFKNDNASNLRRLLSMRPQILRSSPSFLSLLANDNLEHGLGFQVEKVFSVSEVLTPEMRAGIVRSFGCTVRNSYGAVETGPIAFECEKGAMHLHSDSLILEIVDDAGNPLPPGREGNVIITPLWQRTMPLIRYSLEDVSSIRGRCTCGRSSHVLGPVKGRSSEIMVLPSGRLFPWMMIFSTMSRAFPQILEFQGIQGRKGSLLIKIVKAPRSRLQASEVAGVVRSLVPEDLDLEIEFVPSIERTASDKLRSFRSMLGDSSGPV
jgi:phenylacetate-CoA ligase